MLRVCCVSFVAVCCSLFLFVCVAVWCFVVWCMVCDDVKLVFAVRGYPFDRFFCVLVVVDFACCCLFCCVVVRWLLFVDCCSLFVFFVGCRRIVSFRWLWLVVGCCFF